MNQEFNRVNSETLPHFGRRKMPLTKKGRKIMRSMAKQYGKKKGKKVFYASQNKGTISGTHVKGY